MNAAPRDTVNTLFWLRWVALAVQGFALLLAEQLLDFPIAWPWLLPVLLAGFSWNAFTGTWLRRTEHIGHYSVGWQLLFDIIQLGAVLYLTGGAQNPFVSLLLLPIALAVLAGQTAITVLITVSAVLMYWFLMHSAPALHWHADHDMQMSAHLFGMWANFVLTALLLAGFGLHLLNRLQKREQAIHQLREKNLNQETLVSLGTQAAQIAHQIGTPLNTLMLLADELTHLEQASERETLAKEIKQQLQLSQRWLQKLREREQSVPEALHLALPKIIEEWRWFRPDANLQQDWSALASSSPMTDSGLLSPAILNLLNNAYEASLRERSRQVCVSVEQQDKYLLLHIDDEGPGFSDNRGSPTTGLGIGITLSNASIEKLGGEVSWQPREPRGTRTTVKLPL